jgi:hypothetical protein
MYGDLQAVTGRSLPTIAALELPEATEGSEAEKAVIEAVVPEAA